MIRVHVICEGQTEEEFIRHLLAPALLEKQVFLLPSCIWRVGHKGGNVKLSRLSIDVKERLLGDRQCYCTTLFDYYGLSGDFPGKSEGAPLADIADNKLGLSRHCPSGRRIPWVINRHPDSFPMSRCMSLKVCCSAIFQEWRELLAVPVPKRIFGKFALPFRHRNGLMTA